MGDSNMSDRPYPFDDIDEDKGDALVGFGWALADDLVKLL